MTVMRTILNVINMSFLNMINKPYIFPLHFYFKILNNLKSTAWKSITNLCWF